MGAGLKAWATRRANAAAKQTGAAIDCATQLEPQPQREQSTMNKKTANRIANAEAEVKRAHDKYLAACSKLTAIIEAEKKAVADRITKIEADMQAKIALEAAKLNELSKPEIKQAEAAVKDNVRAELGLPPKFSKVA
jgi:hypothetical protein